MLDQRSRLGAADMNRHQRWAAQNPARAWAHQQIRRAVRAGLIVRPSQCGWCGSQTKVVAVPRDLTDPLRDIWWICHWCRWRLKQWQEGGEIPEGRRRAPPLPEQPKTEPGPCIWWINPHQPCGRPGRYQDVFGNRYCGHHKPNRKKRRRKKRRR